MSCNTQVHEMQEFLAWQENPWCASTLYHWSLLPVIFIAYLLTCVCHPVLFSVHTAPPFTHSPLSLWGLRPWPLLPQHPSSSFTSAHASSSLQLHPLLSIPVIFPNSVSESKILHYLPQFLQIKIFLLETNWNNSMSFFLLQHEIQTDFGWVFHRFSSASLSCTDYRKTTRKLFGYLGHTYAV